MVLEWRKMAMASVTGQLEVAGWRLEVGGISLIHTCSHEHIWVPLYSVHVFCQANVGDKRSLEVDVDELIVSFKRIRVQ